MTASETQAEMTDLGNGFARISLTGLEILDEKPTVFQFIDARWLRRPSHLCQALSAWKSNLARLRLLPFTPK